MGGGGDNVANVFVMAQRLPFVQFDAKRGDGFQQQHLDGVGNERNTLGMWGSGYIELLAREITADLHAIRDRAKQRAQQLEQVIEARLQSKGIDYGSLKAYPDGSVEVRPLGIDKDLVIRPFTKRASWFRCASSRTTHSTTITACRVRSASVRVSTTTRTATRMRSALAM